LVCSLRLYRSVGFVARASIGKPQGSANDCSLIASLRSSLPLNALSAIGLTKRRENVRCLYLVCCLRLYRSVIKPKGIATDCSLIASSRLSLPRNASSVIGLDTALRAHQVSIWFVAIAYTDPLVPSQELVSASRNESPTIAVPLPLRVHHYL
jgi:hypothetical protein